MTSKAFAKINLFLDVVGKRDDGFHDIKTILHTISLCDEIDISVEPSDEVSISFSSDDESIDNNSNLVYRAIDLYLRKSGIVATVKAKLHKRIPIQSGLGGGSADAAAALRILNSHFCYFTEEELLAIAAELGSDIPFLCVGGTATCEGRGEIISPILFDTTLHFVIAIGDERVSTPAAYKKLDILYSDFDGSIEKDDFSKSPCLAFMRDESEIKIPIYNIFEKAVMEDARSVGRIKQRMLELGARFSLMSGSGPSVFGIFDTAESAKFAELELKKEGILAFYAQSV